MHECLPATVAKDMIKRFPRIHEDRDPFRVLISTILSQRTRDENTEHASKKLFQFYPDVESLSNSEPEDLYDLIKVSGMYRQKAGRIVEISRILKERFSGRVPANIEELTSLPGVGRKTANIVLNVGFGIPAMSVDTHVHRISNRLGWVSTKLPVQTETALVKLLPTELWGPLNGSMVEFGRAVCKPIAPMCACCPFTSCCLYFAHRGKDDLL